MSWILALTPLPIVMLNKNSLTDKKQNVKTIFPYD